MFRFIPFLFYFIFIAACDAEHLLGYLSQSLEPCSVAVEVFCGILLPFIFNISLCLINA